MQEKMSSQRGVVSNLAQLNDKHMMPPPDFLPRSKEFQSDQFSKGPSQIEKEPTSSDLIEMAATQCLKEPGEPMVINRKINST